MRTILALIRKEFIQIRRNRIMIPAMIVAPLVQMIVLVYAANMNMRDIDFAILDEDGSATSTNLISKYSSSPFFSLAGSVKSLDDATTLLRKDKADIVIHIPANFEKDIISKEKTGVQFLINGINSASAVLMASYAQNILFDYNRQLQAGFFRQQPES
ncbi:MAG: ABC transporter permease, partial [Bacteroidales bacterium]